MPFLEVSKCNSLFSLTYDPVFLQNGLPTNFEQIVEKEKAHAKKGYLEGSPSQIWLVTPGPGAVGIVEADSLEHAERVAEGFPLAQAGLLEVEVIVLVRLYRLRRTLQESRDGLGLNRPTRRRCWLPRPKAILSLEKSRYKN
jgi:hypothetical protein